MIGKRKFARTRAALVLLLGALTTLAAATPALAAAPLMDANVTVNGHSTVTTPSFSTTEAGEQLLAFVASDGPSGAGTQSGTVSGTGLTWTLVKRANSRSGDAEIWATTAPKALVNVTVTSTPAISGFDQSLTVISMKASKGIGASVTRAGANGEPNVSLITTGEGSLVYAVANDWDTATARKLGPNQALLHQYLDTKTGDTFWSQYTAQATGLAGNVVTLNDTAPTSDQWNMASVEILGGGTAPGQVTNVSATVGAGSASLTWSAPSSGGAPTQYTITPYIGSTAQPTITISGTPPATSATITGLTNGTAYTFTVTAANAVGSGPVSEHSNAVTPTAPTVPSAPTAATATAGEGSAMVKWTAPSNGGSTITSYKITPYIGTTAQTATTITGTPPATSATITGLTNGTAYTFTVTATNAIGSGPASSPSNAVTPATAPIAYPDLQVIVPTNEIFISTTSGTKMLEFSHISSDLGIGPLEIRPKYDKLTGISQGYQALYTMPSPGVWKFDHTVPFAGPMIWTPPTDYRFPLAKFWLYGTASGGGPGSIVASSPKVDFCMTSDTRVGGVPNTPANNEYPGDPGCLSPEGILGLSVGWGDKYEATDGGEGIEIPTLPNGTYWLRAEIDPYHYLQESSLSNNITDTKIQIEGNLVKVLEQTHPDSTPPTVTLTSPSAESTVSGTATLQASVSGPHPISSVQFLLDGQPTGSPVTTPPYMMQWTVGSTPPGKHFLSAQASDSEGFIGTATDVPVTTQEGTGGGPDKEPPLVSITNPVANQTASGQAEQVSANVTDNLDAISSVQFYLDGTPLGSPVTSAPYAITWNTTFAGNGSNTLIAQATDVSGNVGTSAPVTVTVENPAHIGPCFVIDANVTANGHGTTTTPSFTTAEAGEQLFAFVGSDGPAGAGKQSATVSGAGLTWKLVQRANSRSGDSEIWWATAPTTLVNATVTSTPSVAGYDQSLTVISMEMSNGIGASVAGGGASGAPSVSLKTTEEGSLVYAVGNDWDTATARTIGANQVMLRQYLDTKTEDTFWSQFDGAVTGPVGETVTLNDTAPTSDSWNMAAVEILGDGPGN